MASACMGLGRVDSLEAQLDVLAGIGPDIADCVPVTPALGPEADRVAVGFVPDNVEGPSDQCEAHGVYVLAV